MQDKINAVIAFYEADQARGITYSMANRLGSMTRDCSSEGYLALKAAGFFPADLRVGNTDTMFHDFEANGWTQLQPNAQGNYDTQRGDAAIWGKRGASGGANGHFMFFVDADNVINCRVAGIKVDNYDQLRGWNGDPEQTFYRYAGGDSAPAPAGDPNDQSVDIGSLIKFSSPLTVEDVQLIGGVWQANIQGLAPAGFTWDDNGVPTEPLVEIDGDGYATSDQDLSAFSTVILPGKFEVLDFGQSGDQWLALINYGTYKFWVDLAGATEVPDSDPGTPTPSPRPQSPTPPSTPVPEPPVTVPEHQEPVVQDDAPAAVDPPVQTDPDPPAPTESTTIPSQPTKETNEEKEPTKMAFTEEQQTKLNAVTEDLASKGEEVAAGDPAQKIINGISDKTKMIVYFVGDTLLGLGAVTPQVAIILMSPDPYAKVAATSSLLATTGLYVLTMFGIYKSGK